MITKEGRIYKENGEIIKLPSVNYYPKGEGFYRWLATNGWNESERIKEEAGKRGGNIHSAIEKYLITNEIEKELTSIEVDILNKFIKWFSELNQTKRVKIIGIEISGINREYNYVGTIDLILEIDGEVWIIDVKTSNYLHKSHNLQLSAYKHMYNDKAKIALLHIKDYCKFVEVEDKFDIFLAVKKIWEYENRRTN